MTAGQAMRVAVTGASGLIGRALVKVLNENGEQVTGLRRGGGETSWDVATGEIRVAGGVDAIVHLAGRNVAVRWTRRVRREIWESRVTATEKLCGFLAGMQEAQRPRVLVTASGIGVYGDRGEEVLTEESAPAARGQSFLADVCAGWEGATRAAEAAGIRVVNARIGVVLAKEGGALAKLLTPVKLGLGGPIGSGRQWMSWVSLRDAVRMLAAMVRDAELRGPVNVVAGTVRQQQFMRTLGRVVHRPTIFPMPAVAVKAAFGAMGREVLLGSQRVTATRLPAGFAFRDTSLEEAIRGALEPVG